MYGDHKMLVSVEEIHAEQRAKALDKANLLKLKNKAAERKLVYTHLGLANTPQAATEEDKNKRAMELDIAFKLWLRAEDEYQEALKRYISYV